MIFCTVLLLLQPWWLVCCPRGRSRFSDVLMHGNEYLINKRFYYVSNWISLPKIVLQHQNEYQRKSYIGTCISLLMFSIFYCCYHHITGTIYLLYYLYICIVTICWQISKPYFFCFVRFLSPVSFDHIWLLHWVIPFPIAVFLAHWFHTCIYLPTWVDDIDIL